MAMIWNNIMNRFDEEMIETLFGYAATGKTNSGPKKESAPPPPRFIQLIDPKKSQNLSIILKALNVTANEVCEAIEEGDFVYCCPFYFGKIKIDVKHKV